MIKQEWGFFLVDDIGYLEGQSYGSFIQVPGQHSTLDHLTGVKHLLWVSYLLRAQLFLWYKSLQKNMTFSLIN